jgi:hypothetical protein
MHVNAKIVLVSLSEFAFFYTTWIWNDQLIRIVKDNFAFSNTWFLFMEGPINSEMANLLKLNEDRALHSLFYVHLEIFINIRKDV